METPDRVKVNILTLLVEQGQGVRKGIALDRLTSLYGEHFKEPLDIKAWGSACLLEFFQAMPQLFRLKFERREEAWKVFPILKRNPLLPKHLRPVTPPTTVYPGRSQQQTPDTAAASEMSCSGNTMEEDTGQVDVSQLTLVPDQKGLYSVCFPSERKPEEWTDLKEMFTMAGHVVEIHRLPKMTFVRYSSPDAIRLAMKMFPFLGLSVARANIEAGRQGRCQSLSSQPKDELGAEVSIQNLHNHFAVTKVHLQELFHGFDLLHVEVHYDSSLCTQYAVVRLATDSEARRLIAQFDGHNFLGQNLFISMKKPDRATGTHKENLPAQSQFSRPPWRSSTPRHQDNDMPALEPHSNSGNLSSLNRDIDRVMESDNQEQASECEMVEENVCKKPLIGRVLGENRPPRGKDGVELKKADLRCGSERKTSKRDEGVGIDFLKQLVRQMSGKNHGKLSHSERFPVEQIAARVRDQIGGGCRTENSLMEQRPSKMSQERRVLQSNYLQQLNDREKPRGRGHYWGNSHQRRASIEERSQSRQEGLSRKTAPQKRMFDRDLALEDRENDHHNTFMPSSSFNKQTPQRGFCHDQQRPNPGRRSTHTTGEYVHDDVSQSDHRDSTHRDEMNTRNTIFRETFKSKPPHEYCTEGNYQEFQCEEDVFEEREGYMESRHLRPGPSEDLEGAGEGDRMVCVPQMSPLEERIRETGVELPCIFVTHFQQWATEKHLSRWFAPYNPISVCLVQCAKTGMPKAHIELSDEEMVRRAVYEMNQQRVCAMKIKVDVPFFLPRLRAQVLGTNPVSLKRMRNPKLSPFIGDQGMLEELSLQRVRVGGQLNGPDFTLHCGQEVEVTVTHVINDSLFMGQLMWPDVLHKLREIRKELTTAADNRSSPSMRARLDFQGPCIAKWKKDYKWHRAWLLSGHGHTNTAEVYLLDEGFLDLVAWSHVRRYDSPGLWELPPVALPFSLSEPIVKLKNRLHSQITLTVTAIDKNGIVTAKPVSLVSNWKQILNIDTVLC